MLNEFNELSNRRTMLSKGSALVSACLLTTPIPVKAQTSQVTNADPVIDVKKFGATGRREDNATKAFRDAIEACVKRGGGTVNVPPGAYTVGTIQLEDNITLNIEAGATLFLSQLKEDFIEGARSMIYAENAKNIAVTGKGTLDGLAQYDYVEMRKLDVDIKEEVELAKASGTVLRRYYRKSTAMNVFMFVINDCTNFLLSDVTVINSPLWNVKLSDCDRVFVRGVYIYSDPPLHR
jgi:polygalacturonase